MTRRVIDTTGEELARNIADFEQSWLQGSQDALTGALLFGGFMEDVILRTPQSEFMRYKARIQEAIEQGEPHDDAERYEYGQQRLLKSLVKSGRTAGPSDFEVIRHNRDLRLTLSSNAPYALHIHETEKPGEGEYSVKVTQTIKDENGKARKISFYTDGWSKRGTGNKFIEKPWDDNEEATTRQFVKNLDILLQKAGLL